MLTFLKYLFTKLIHHIFSLTNTSYNFELIFFLMLDIAIANSEKYYGRFYNRQFYMPYEDSRLTTSLEPPYRIHAWRYSLCHAADLLYGVSPLIHIISFSPGIETQTFWFKNINEPLVKLLDQGDFHNFKLILKEVILRTLV